MELPIDLFFYDSLIDEQIVLHQVLIAISRVSSRIPLVDPPLNVLNCHEIQLRRIWFPENV